MCKTCFGLGVWGRLELYRPVRTLGTLKASFWLASNQKGWRFEQNILLSGFDLASWQNWFLIDTLAWSLLDTQTFTQIFRISLRLYSDTYLGKMSAAEASACQIWTQAGKWRFSSPKLRHKMWQSLYIFQHQLFDIRQLLDHFGIHWYQFTNI